MVKKTQTPLLGVFFPVCLCLAWFYDTWLHKFVSGYAGGAHEVGARSQADLQAVSRNLCQGNISHELCPKESVEIHET